MKTLFSNHNTKTIESFTFDVLNCEELALIKGGKAADSYADLD